MLQVSVAFAEMHDTPTRMVAKGVLHGIVPWSRARHFLALRLKRRYCLPPSPLDQSTSPRDISVAIISPLIKSLSVAFIRI